MWLLFPPLVFGLNASVFDLNWIILSDIISCVSYTLWHIVKQALYIWMTTRSKVFIIFFLLIVIFNYSWGYSEWNLSFSPTPVSLFTFLCFSFQIQNADDVLITPLEKFRKEQIGAAKVRDHLQAQLAVEQQRMFHVFWHLCFSSSPPPAPLQNVNH